jgi:hypothetical protein
MRNYYSPEPVTTLLTRSVMMTAQLKDYSTIHLVNETLEAGQDEAGVVLVTKEGEEVEIFKAAPFKEAETFFLDYVRECKAHGDEPVITYCSYD